MVDFVREFLKELCIADKTGSYEYFDDMVAGLKEWAEQRDFTNTSLEYSCVDGIYFWFTFEHCEFGMHGRFGDENDKILLDLRIHNGTITFDAKNIQNSTMQSIHNDAHIHLRKEKDTIYGA